MHHSLWWTKTKGKYDLDSGMIIQEEPMKISVVIPVYKVEKYIRECVDSVLSQTLTDIEVILVDDGSPDQCGSILDEYANKDSRVKVIHKKNEGVSAARNDGLQLCSGQYLYIMDSDDYIEPNALEVMYQNACSTGADVVITDHWTFREDQQQIPHHFFNKAFVTEDHEIIMRLQQMVLHSGYSPYPSKENTGLGISTPWTKLLKASLVQENGLRFDSYVHGIFDDGLFALAVFEFAKKVSYVPEQLYHYRILPSSLIHRFSANRLEIDRKVFQRIEEFKVNHNKGEQFQLSYYAKIVQFWVRSFAVYFFHEEYPKNRNNYKEFLMTAKSAPYHEAIRNVDLNVLKKVQKYCVILSRLHLNWAIWAAFKGYRVLNHGKSINKL